MTTIDADFQQDAQKYRARPRLAGGSEADLVLNCVRLVKRQWPVRALGLETKSHGRCRTDISVRIRDVNDLAGPEYLIGIEAKLTDFKRALRQAVFNQYAVHGSFVAMPIRRVSPELVESARDYGIGVLGVSAKELVVMEPAILGSPDTSLHKRMNAQLIVTRARGRTPVGQIVERGLS